MTMQNTTKRRSIDLLCGNNVSTDEEFWSNENPAYISHHQCTSIVTYYVLFISLNSSKEFPDEYSRRHLAHFRLNFKI